MRERGNEGGRESLIPSFSRSSRQHRNFRAHGSVRKTYSEPEVPFYAQSIDRADTACLYACLPRACACERTDQLCQSVRILRPFHAFPASWPGCAAIARLSADVQVFREQLPIRRAV